MPKNLAYADGSKFAKIRCVHFNFFLTLDEKEFSKINVNVSLFYLLGVYTSMQSQNQALTSGLYDIIN